MQMNKGLTSFRALAFFGIFLSHVSWISQDRLGVQGGYLGVEAFFVLSGFLLTPILVDMKSNLNSRDFFIHFYGRRALRIFPLYYLYILAVASCYLLAIALYKSGYFEAISTFLYGLITELNKFIHQLPWVASYGYDFYHASNKFTESFFASHFWSLAIEEQFYLVWPMAIFFIPAPFFKRFLLLIIVLGPIVRFLLARIIDSNQLPLAPQSFLTIYFLPFSYLDAFAIGGYFALYEKSRSSYFVWSLILLVFMLGIVTSWLSTGQIHWGQLGYGLAMMDSYKYVWGYSMVNLMFAYVLVYVKNGTFLPAIFNNHILVYVGTISYGLYVFHFPVLWLIWTTMHSYPEIVRTLIALMITIMISMVSYELMEKRFINLKDSFFSRTSADKQSA